MSRPIKKFVVVTMARTGSNALLTAMMRHPNLYADYELFHDSLIPGLMADKTTIENRDKDPDGFLEQASALALSAKPATQIYGFKIFFGHNDTLLKELVRDSAYSVILLKRSNILDQYLSLEIAQNTNQWTSLNGDKTSQITVSEKKFLKFHNEVQRSYEWLESLLNDTKKSYLTITYDDVCRQSYDQIYQFLGLDTAYALETALKKQNPAATADKVTNPREVKKMLRKHGLMHMWVEKKGQEKPRPFGFLNFWKN